MARCAVCQTGLPYRTALKNLFKKKYDPAKLRYRCAVCGKVSVLPTGAFLLSVLFVTGAGAATSVWVFLSPWFKPSGGSGEFAVGLVTVGSGFFWHFIWWTSLARLKSGDSGGPV